VPQVYALAAATDERYRVLVLLAAFTSLRWGELAALRRSDIDAQARTVRVTRQLNERDGSGFSFGPPKSEAGVRIVAIPELITSDLAAHIMTYARPGDDGLIFTSPGSGPPSGYDGSIGPTITRPSHAQAHQLPAPVLGACPGGGRAPGDALSRPAPYREHARGSERSCICCIIRRFA
jgi:integrase